MCSCDFDVNRMEREEFRRARKAYTCSECYAPITSGDRYMYIFFVDYDGDARSKRMCGACGDLLAAADILRGFCWLYGTLRPSFASCLRDCAEDPSVVAAGKGALAIHKQAVKAAGGIFRSGDS